LRGVLAHGTLIRFFRGLAGRYQIVTKFYANKLHNVGLIGYACSNKQGEIEVAERGNTNEQVQVVSKLQARGY
jgi:hypothetical protein